MGGDWDDNYYRANITHNLNVLADAVGFYKEVWHPEEVGITKAWQLIAPLSRGLEELETFPEYYSRFNAPNGWGVYPNFVRFIRNYLQACEQCPNAFVAAAR